MEKSQATTKEDYDSKFLENIFDTDFYYGVPYKIDYQKFCKIVHENTDHIIVIKEGDSLTFHTSRQKSFYVDENIYYFYAWSTKNYENVFDVFRFEQKENESEKALNKRFKRFVKEILSCIIDVDKNALKGLKKAEIKELHKIQAKLDKIDEILAKK